MVENCYINVSDWKLEGTKLLVTADLSIAIGYHLVVKSFEIY